MAKHIHAALLAAFILAMCPRPGLATEEQGLSQGGYIFVPAYEQVFIGGNSRPFLLAVNLCLRNASLNEAISVVSVDYYDSDGKLLKKYVSAPRPLGALASLTFTIAESESKGGPGAKFVIAWRSAKPVTPPLAEAVMSGTGGQQGISFTSRGLALPGRP